KATDAGAIAANRIAMWDGGRWSSLGDGMNSDVYAMTVWQGALYAGGAFNAAGGSPAGHVAKWTGTSWSAVADGLSGSVRALAGLNDRLYAGGQFTQGGFGNRADGLAALFHDGSGIPFWACLEACGIGKGTTALAVAGNSLYVASESGFSKYT